MNFSFPAMETYQVILLAALEGKKERNRLLQRTRVLGKCGPVFIIGNGCII